MSNTLCTLPQCLIFHKYSLSTYRNFVFNKEKKPNPPPPKKTLVGGTASEDQAVYVTAQNSTECPSQDSPGCECRLPFPILPPWGMHLVLKVTKIKKLKGTANCIGLSQGSQPFLMSRKAKPAVFRRGFSRLHSLGHLYWGSQLHP